MDGMSAAATATTMVAPAAVPQPAARPGVPRHVGIIMDGNGRWAAARGVPRAMGHKAGAEAARRAVEAAGEAGVGWLTLFAFSSENWQRPADEVRDLTALMRHYLATEVDRLAKEGVRLRIIGERDRFGPDTVRAIARAEQVTAGGTRLNLTVALSYGGRAEIAAAAREIARRAAAGTLDPETVDERLFEGFLGTVGMPDPDLIIRTSGEVRLSGFLPWQSAYSEFYFCEAYWPAFREIDFLRAIRTYQQRARRFGR
jgi:undecaprenyl diphosphate synthase